MRKILAMGHRLPHIYCVDRRNRAPILFIMRLPQATLTMNLGCLRRSRPSQHWSGATLPQESGSETKIRLLRLA